MFLLNHVPTLVIEDMNRGITKEPVEEEVKRVVFELNGESASGPDGLTGIFFQSCWDIFGGDVVKMI